MGKPLLVQGFFLFHSFHEVEVLQLLVWSEYMYRFIVCASMNLRIEVSIQGGVFDVPINFDTSY